MSIEKTALKLFHFPFSIFLKLNTFGGVFVKGVTDKKGWWLGESRG